MKKSLVALTLSLLFSNIVLAQDVKSVLGGILNSTVAKVKNESTTKSTSAVEKVFNLNLSNSTIASGLKEALSIGLTDGLKNLGQKNGFYNSSVAKIVMPSELQTVEKTLRSVGLGSLADKGVKLLNTAAEDAVKEAAPIFVNALTSMNFSDAKTILVGGDRAATNYLKAKTTADLVAAFQPKISASLGKVGANKVWTQLISKYNKFTDNPVNTDLDAYVTEQAINGVFNMVAEKEAGIRNNPALQTTTLLQQVFGGKK